jgi:hypothetical protein
MKSFVALLASCTLLLVACKEIPPYIDYTVPVPSKDTSYIASAVPPAQHKAVLIEDITGVRCNNCPQAAQQAAAIQTAKTEDSVVVMALYSADYNSFLTSPWGAPFPDLNSPYSNQLLSQLGAPLGLPSGYIDRAKNGSQTVKYTAYTNWSNYVNQRLRDSTPVNIELSKTLSGRNLSLKMKLVYTTAVTEKHKYALYLTESGIKSKQATAATYDDNYLHNHVLRYAFGNAVGNDLTKSLVVGRTFEKIIDYTVPLDYDISKCHIVCVVIDDATDAIVNVRELKL